MEKGYYRHATNNHKQVFPWEFAKSSSYVLIEDTRAARALPINYTVNIPASSMFNFWVENLNLYKIDKLSLDVYI